MSFYYPWNTMLACY